MRHLALDIGGANLKVADGVGYAVSTPFPLWQQVAQLPETLAQLLAAAPPADQLVVTMTGELADCFATKAEGVHTIVAAVEQAAGPRQVLVYLCDGRAVDPAAARAAPLRAAASNWHALAAYASRLGGHEPGLLVDVGSTTTDLIPLAATGPQTLGLTDPERLVAGELVYTGVERSPVCAVVGSLVWKSEACAVAQELFATTLDAYLLLGHLPENPSDCQTADGRPRTRAHAHARLARMICADATMFTRLEAERAAAEICQAQLDLLSAAATQILARMPEPPARFVLSGQGEFLARELVQLIARDRPVISLAQEWAPEVSCCACAHALASLARRGLGMSRSLVRVVKVGGSLLDLDDLALRTRQWLSAQTPAHHVLIAGGGPLADQVRSWHAQRPLSEVAAHWMCVDAMTITARLLHARLPEIGLVENDALLCQRVGERNCTIFSVGHWLRHAEADIPGTRLPASWEVTSDAIAGRLAVALAADELVLMKSALPFEATSALLTGLATQGYVDPMLPRMQLDLPPLRLVNLRETPPREVAWPRVARAKPHTGN